MPHIWVSESEQHWFQQWIVAYSAPSYIWTYARMLLSPYGQNFVKSSSKFMHFIQENSFNNVVREMAAILSRGQLDKYCILRAVMPIYPLQ